MRKTKYVSGYGYITGDGIFDTLKEIATNIGTSTMKALGNRAGQALANKIVKPKKPNQSTRESVLKELSLLPANKKSSFGINEDVRKALYGSGKKTHGRGMRVLI